MAATSGARPSIESVLAALKQHGTIADAARDLGVPRKTLSDRIGRTPELKAAVGKSEGPAVEAAGLTVSGNNATLTEPPTARPKLGDVAKLIRERGLDPAEWVVVSTTLNEWDALTTGGGTQRLKQWKVSLKRRPEFVLLQPARHVPRIETKVRVRKNEVPELIVVESDHQAPYHDLKLHEASLRALASWHDDYNMTEHVFAGDTSDFPTLSQYPDHPAAEAAAQECVQVGYEILRAKREASPNARARKLKGNHDCRIDKEQLLRAERTYGLAPADKGDGVKQLPALHLNRLWYLDELGIELIEDIRGWQHAEVELVPGIFGLVVRHGWLTTKDTATASAQRRGRSIIVGHKHAREHVYFWDPSAECERQGVIMGAMCRVDGVFPHFAVLPGWLQGLVTVSRWPSGQFVIDHARWDGKHLSWRDRQW